MADKSYGFSVVALSRGFSEVTKGLEKLGRTLDEIDRKKATANVDVDTAKAEAKVGKFARDLQSKVERAVRSLPEVTLTANSTDVDRRIAAIRRELAAIADKRIGFGVDTAEAHRRVERLSSELERLSRRSPNIDVRADTAAAAAALAGVSGLASRIDGQRVNIAVNASDVSRAIGLVGLLTAGLAGVAAAAAPAAAGIAALGPLAAAGAQGVGALAVAFSGVGDAVKALSKAEKEITATGEASAATLKKINEEMAGLSPEAQRFARFLVDEILPGLRGIRDEVQASLLPQLETSMRTLGELSPIVSAGLTETGRVIGDLSIKGANMMTSGPWKRDFATIMAGNNRVLGDFGEVGLDVLDMLRNLGVASLPMVERFSQATERAAELGRQWLETKRATGELDEFFDQMGDTIAELVHIVGQLITAAVQISQAMGPVGMVLLETIGNLAQFIGEIAQAHPELTQLVATLLIAAAAFSKIGSAIAGAGVAIPVMLGGWRSLLDLVTRFSPAAVAASATMQRVSAGMQAASLSAGVLTERFTGSAAAGEKVATSGSKVSNALTKVGATLPVLGAVIVGLGLAYDGLVTSSDEAADALLKGGAAAEQVAAKMSWQNSVTEVARTQYSSNIPVLRELLYVRNAFTGALANAIPTTEDATRAMQEQLAAMDPLARAQALATQSQNDYLHAVEKYGPTSIQAINATRDYALHSEELTRQQDLLKNGLTGATDAMLAQRDAILGNLDAEIRYESAVDSLTQSLADNGVSVDLNTEAGRRNVSALNDMSRSSSDVIGRMIEQGASQDQVSAKATVMRDAIYNAALQIGYTRDQARTYVDQLNLVPGQIGTRMWLDTAGAQETLDRFLVDNNNRPLHTRLVADTGDLVHQIRAAGSIDVRPMAAGGFRAAVVAANTPTLIGDHPRVPESYIPWDRSSSRAHRILETTAAGMGRHILPMAAGGVLGELPGSVGSRVVPPGMPGGGGLSELNPDEATTALRGLADVLRDRLSPALTDAQTLIGTDTKQSITDLTTATTDGSTTMGRDWDGLQERIRAATDRVRASLLHLQDQHNFSWMDMRARSGSEISQITGPQFGGLHAGMDAVQNHAWRMAGGVGGEYARLRGLTADPIRWSLDFPINRGLVPAWNSIDRFFALNRPMGQVPVGFSSGGKVPGAGSSDTVPALLTPGEFVVKKQIAEPTKHFLAALNEGQAEAVQAAGGRFTRFAEGGTVEKVQTFARAQHGKPYIWASAGPDGYDCCIIGDVRVYGPDGSTPIRDLRPGDRVFSYENGRLETHTVTAQWQSKRQPVFAVRTRNRKVVASANHPFLVLREVADRVTHREHAYWPGPPFGRKPWGSQRGATCSVSTCARPAYSADLCTTHHTRFRKHGDPRITVTTGKKYDVEWVRLDQLHRGDMLVQPRSMHPDAKPDPVLADETPIDRDVAWLIGAAVGDGTVTSKSLRLCLYGEFRERATAIIRERWECNPLHGQEYGLVASSVRLATALADLGMRRLGPDKRMPVAVWSWREELQRSFLDGYCDADGHRPRDTSRHGQRVYHSSSEELIADVRALHMMLGDAVSNVYTNNRTKPITIKGVVVRHARPLHGFTVWNGNRNGETVLRARPHIADWLDTGDFTLGKICSIRAEGEQDTWDIEVEGSHNFIADGVVVHNSGFQSALTNVAMGQYPHRRLFSTASFAGGPVAGFTPGLTSAYGIGVFQGNPGHVAGTVQGLNVEAGGSPSMTKAGPGAAGATHPQFRQHFSLPMVGGRFIPGGFDTAAYLKKEFAETRRMIDEIRPRWGGGNPPTAMHRWASDAAAGAEDNVGFDRGGIARGRGWMFKRTVRPERVLDPRTTEAFEQLSRVLGTVRGSLPATSWFGQQSSAPGGSAGAGPDFSALAELIGRKIQEAMPKLDGATFQFEDKHGGLGRIVTRQQQRYSRR